MTIEALENKIHELKEKGIAPMELSLFELLLPAMSEEELEELNSELDKL